MSDSEKKVSDTLDIRDKNWPLAIVTFTMIFILILIFGNIIFRFVKMYKNNNYIEACGIHLDLKQGGWAYDESATSEWEEKLGINQEYNNKWTGDCLKAFKNKNSTLVFSKKRLSDSELKELSNYTNIEDILSHAYPNSEHFNLIRSDSNFWIFDNKEIETWSTMLDGYEYEVRLDFNDKTLKIYSDSLRILRNDMNTYIINGKEIEDEHEINSLDEWHKRRYQ